MWIYLFSAPKGCCVWKVLWEKNRFHWVKNESETRLELAQASTAARDKWCATQQVAKTGTMSLIRATAPVSGPVITDAPSHAPASLNRSRVEHSVRTLFFANNWCKVINSTERYRVILKACCSVRYALHWAHVRAERIPGNVLAWLRYGGLEIAGSTKHVACGLEQRCFVSSLPEVGDTPNQPLFFVSQAWIWQKYHC